MSDTTPQEQKAKTLAFPIFCAKCQDDTDHICRVDTNGELNFICAVCDGFIKLPPGLSLEEKLAYFAAHKRDNKGQISIEGSYKELDEIMDYVPEAPTPEPVEDTPAQ